MQGAVVLRYKVFERQIAALGFAFFCRASESGWRVDEALRGFFDFAGEKLLFRSDVGASEGQAVGCGCLPASMQPAEQVAADRVKEVAALKPIEIIDSIQRAKACFGAM